MVGVALAWASNQQESTVAEQRNETRLMLHVSFNAQYGDGSYLRGNGLVQTGPNFETTSSKSNEAIRDAVDCVKGILEAVNKAETKTKPSSYVLPLHVNAYYVDGREATRREQHHIIDSGRVVAVADDWFTKSVKELIDIGNDDI